MVAVVLTTYDEKNAAALLGKKKIPLINSIVIKGICRDPGGILTLDLQNRNLTLYTAKLRSH